MALRIELRPGERILIGECIDVATVYAWSHSIANRVVTRNTIGLRQIADKEVLGSEIQGREVLFEVGHLSFVNRLKHNRFCVKIDLFALIFHNTTNT